MPLLLATSSFLFLYFLHFRGRKNIVTRETLDRDGLIGITLQEPGRLGIVLMRSLTLTLEGLGRSK